MMEFALVFFVIALAGLIYFLPTVIAVTRNHANTTAIFWLNLLLGWTGIVWIVLVAWAILRDD